VRNEQKEEVAFLEKHKGWAIALGFHNGVPHESDVTKFINKIGADLGVYFIHLLRFIREKVSIEGIKAFHIIGFLKHNNRIGVRIRTGTGRKFTRYSQRKKRASTHGAGMTLILYDRKRGYARHFDTFTRCGEIFSNRAEKIVQTDSPVVESVETYRNQCRIGGQQKDKCREMHNLLQKDSFRKIPERGH